MAHDAPHRSNSRGGDVANAFRVGAFIALLGPPLGSLPVSLLFSVYVLISRQTSIALDDLVGVSGMVLLAALFSYVVGGVPALLSAIWLGRKTYHWGRFTYRQAITTALVASLPVVMPMILRSPINNMTNAVVVASLAIFSAIACRFLIGRIDWLDRETA